MSSPEVKGSDTRERSGSESDSAWWESTTKNWTQANLAYLTCKNQVRAIRQLMRDPHNQTALRLAHEAFWAMIKTEIAKINAAYLTRAQDLDRCLSEIEMRLRQPTTTQILSSAIFKAFSELAVSPSGSDTEATFVRTFVAFRQLGMDLDDLRKACSLLRNCNDKNRSFLQYVVANYVGVLKLIKRYDKSTGQKSKEVSGDCSQSFSSCCLCAQTFVPLLANEPFCKETALNTMVARIDTIVQSILVGRAVLSLDC